MAITINHQTNDLSATSGSITIDGSAAGGGASLQTTEALVNGDLVSLNSTGTVSKTSLGGNLLAGSSTTVTTAGNQYIKNSTVATNGSGTFVTLYRADSSYPYVVAHTVVGTTITTGTPVVLRSSAQQDASAIIYDAAQQKYLVVCPFSDYSQAFVLSVSGTTITASSSTNLPQKGGGWAGDYDASQNKGVFLYTRNSDNDPYVVAATISGTSVSFNTPALVQNINYAYIYELSYNSTAQKTVAFYTDDTGNVAYANAIGLSGSTFTIGSAVTVATGDKGYSFSIHGQSSVGFIYRNRVSGGSLEAKARVGSISGTTITLGTEVAVGSGRSDYNWGFYDSSSGKIIFGFEDTNPPKIRPATLSGTTITLGTATTLSTGVSGYLADKRVSKNASGALMMQFQSYSPQGIHVIALEVSGSNIDDFIGIAGATIAANATGTINTLSDINTGQSSLTIGSKYYLQADGTLGTTVVAGKEVGIALSATDLLITYDPAATAGGGGSLTTAAISGSSQTVDFTKDIVTSTVASKTTTFAFSGASAVDKTTLIIDNNYSEPYAAGDTSFNSKAANDADFSDSNSHTLTSFAFSPNGSSVALLANNGELIYHTLSTAFDLSTISASRGASVDLRASSYTANNGTQRSVQWANNGSDVFVLTGTGNMFVRLSVSSANTFTGMSRSWSFVPTFSMGSQTQIHVPNSGVKYFFADPTNNIIRTYTPSTAFGQSGSYTETFSPSWKPNALAFNPSGTKVVIMDQSKVLYMYTLSTAYDLSTLSFVGKGPDIDTLVGAGGVATYVSVYQIAFNGDGTKLIAASNQNDQLLYDFNINGAVSFTFPSAAEIPASLPAPPKNKKLAIDFATTDGGTSYQVTGTAESVA